MQGKIDMVVHARGFGFIRADDGRKVFFHRISLVELDFNTLREGQTVDFDLQHGEFEIKHGEKGLRAASVRLQPALSSPYSGVAGNGAYL
jgi:cold shock CspA family protein